MKEADSKPGAEESSIRELEKSLARSERTIRFWTGADIEVEAPKKTDWVVRPWVARGAITEVDGKAKVAGKTTWLTHVVAEVIGGKPFLGEPTTKSPVVYLTEQSVETFRPALAGTGLVGSLDFRVVFWNETLGISWSKIVKAARSECRRIKAKLLVIDTLPQFAKIAADGENSAGDALEAMRPLQKAAHRGHLAIVVCRHERKSGGEVGDSARGSSAFGGAVDVILSLRRPEGNHRPTVREIHSLSRFSETPPRLVIELTKQGYVSHGTTSAFAAREAEAAILAAAPAKKKQALPREQLLKKAGVIADTTGRRAIDKLLRKRQLFRLGSGKKSDPYRFWVKTASTASSGST